VRPTVNDSSGVVSSTRQCTGGSISMPLLRNHQEPIIPLLESAPSSYDRRSSQ
jgi:hypothetical protein